MVETIVVDIGSDGERLQVVAGETMHPVGSPPLRPSRIQVDAYPFHGMIETLLTQDDVDDWLKRIELFRRAGRATLGGGRAPLVELTRDGDVIEVLVQNSGDDPWPAIRYLIFPSDG